MEIFRLLYSYDPPVILPRSPVLHLHNHVIVLAQAENSI